MFRPWDHNSTALSSRCRDVTSETHPSATTGQPTGHTTESTADPRTRRQPACRRVRPSCSCPRPLDDVADRVLADTEVARGPPVAPTVSDQAKHPRRQTIRLRTMPELLPPVRDGVAAIGRAWGLGAGERGLPGLSFPRRRTRARRVERNNGPRTHENRPHAAIGLWMPPYTGRRSAPPSRPLRGLTVDLEIEGTERMEN